MNLAHACEVLQGKNGEDISFYGARDTLPLLVNWRIQISPLESSVRMGG